MYMLILKCYLIVAVMSVSSKQITSRYKRDDSDYDWNWGNDEDTLNVTEELPPNPCNDPKAIKPSFAVPGRRISAEKCYEYIWELKNRVTEHEKDLKCKEYRALYENFEETAVVGGHDTEIGEYSHMGAIGWKAFPDSWIFNCGGILISSKYLLTAGHCTAASDRDSRILDIIPKIVRLGAKNIYEDDDDFVDVNIKRIINHPQYKPPKKYYDLALMELENRVTFSRTLQPACLWNKHDYSFGSKATVSGWGISRYGDLHNSEVLKAGDVAIINYAQCRDFYANHTNKRHFDQLEDHQICAGDPEGKVDTCQGDSGAPLQVKIPIPELDASQQGSMYFVIGVTSFGYGCGIAGEPGIYTRVSSFLDWIESVVWLEK